MMPSRASSPSEPNMHLLEGAGGGCSPQQTMDILSALDSIYEPSNLARLYSINPVAAGKLLAQLGGGTIEISCGLHCNLWAGIADSTASPQTINLDADWLFAGSDWSFLKETLMHELFHAAGFGESHGTNSDPCNPPCPTCTVWNAQICQCDLSPKPECQSQMIYCNCNKQCYTSGGACTSDCHDSLACFTAICAPAVTGQCGL